MDPLGLLFYNSWLLALDDLRRGGDPPCRSDEENSYYAAAEDQSAWVRGLVALGAVAALVLIAAAIDRIGA